MSKVNQLKVREWLAENLAARGYGAQAELANYLSVDQNAVSKMLNAQSYRGYRAIRADELIEMANFFGALPPGLAVKETPPEHTKLIALFERFPPERRQLILTWLEAFSPARQKK